MGSGRAGVEIQLWRVQYLLEYARRDQKGFLMSFGLRKFRAQYGDAFEGTDLLEEKPGAWRCRIRGLMDEDCWVLCNPEDVVRCKKCIGSDELCRACQIPLCHRCLKFILPGGQKGGIPWSLANDNFWDETCSLLYKYNVT